MITSKLSVRQWEICKNWNSSIVLWKRIMQLRKLEIMFSNLFKETLIQKKNQLKATWSTLLMTSESFQETQINISLNLRISFAWLTNKNRETQDAVRIPYILFIFSTDWCIRSLQSQWLNKTDQAYTNIDKKALILLKNYQF